MQTWAKNAVFWLKVLFFGMKIFCYYLGRILIISGQSPIAIKSTLNFGLWSTKLGGTIQATKTPGRNYREAAVFTFCAKGENTSKICSFFL